MFLDLELHDVSILTHDLEVDVLGVSLVLCLTCHGPSEQLTVREIDSVISEGRLI